MSDPVVVVEGVGEGEGGERSVSQPESGPSLSTYPKCADCNHQHARWTGSQWRPTCSAHRKRSGRTIPCTMWPNRAQTVCRKHGGSAPAAKLAAKRRQALERITEELDSMGGSIDVTPTDAMVAMVREAAWNVAYLRRLVDSLETRVEGEPDAAELGRGIAQRESPDNWKAAPHVWVKMYEDWCDRLVKYSKMCRDAGVEERLVLVAEEQGMWLVKTLDRVLSSLHLTDEQQALLPGVMQAVILELEAGSSS